MRYLKNITLSSLLLLLLFYAGLSAKFAVFDALSVDIRRPAENELVGNTLFISAKVETQFEIRSVMALVDDRQGELTYNGAENTFEGTLSLEDLSLGQKKLIVKAEDVFDNTAQDSIDFIYDPPPDVEASQPLTESVARPNIQVTASCSDLGSDKCTILLRLQDRHNNRTDLVSNERELAIDLDISNWDGQEVTLQIIAADSAGQETKISRTIFVESSTSLFEVETVDGRIVDADSNRILYIYQAGNESEILIIYNRTDNNSSEIPLQNNRIMHSALTPFGAIFESNDGNRNRIIEFHNTELLDHGEGNSLMVAGTYAIWSAGFAGRQLFLRDLVLQNTIEIAVDGLELGNTDNDVEPDGTVFFWTLDDYDIYRYRNGIVTKLTDDDSQKIWNVAPLGTGELVIYQKSTPCCNNQSFAIALNNGANEIILREFNQFRTSSEYDYQIMNNWIAFTRIGNLEQTHVWLRNSIGEEKQLSFFASSSRIETLHSNGTLTFINDGGRYLANFKGSLEEISSDLGQSLIIDGDWYINIGRNLFEVSTNVTHVEFKDIIEPKSAVLLSPAYPNPFNPQTIIEFEIQDRTHIELVIYNLQGQLITRLVDGIMEAGHHLTKWDGTDQFGGQVASGFYVYQIVASDYVATRKIILLR